MLLVWASARPSAGVRRLASHLTFPFHCERGVRKPV
jgi:hypothetical protein